MSEDKSLEENFETANARITPGVTIGGMGEVSLPNADNGNIGSGDVPDVADIDDDEEEAKKDKTKKKLEMEGFKLFTQFNNFVTEGEEVAKSDKIYEEAILENAVRDLHFETDPKKAEELKIEIGASQGEVTRRKQIEGGDYSLRRFRKEIKYDETGEDLGVFKPGSYMAATSKLGDGPHKKAAKKVRWNQKMYDQWIEDVASNGGWQYAFDMAQNAKHERGLIDWVKKNHRGEDPMQRIQWDIEAFAESTVTEAKGLPSHARNLSRKLKTHWLPDTDSKDIYFLADTNKGQTITIDLSVRTGEYKVIDKKDNVIYQGGDPYAAAKLIESVVTEAMSVEVGEYIKTQYGYFYKRVDGKVGGQEAFVEIKKGKEGKRKTSIHDTVSFEVVDKDAAFESVTKDHFSEFCKLNEAKSVDRDEMMKWIKKSMDFVGTSEDFNGSQGGIHVSGEAGDEYKGAIIYSYYSEDYKNREFGVWNKWEKELNKRGWYSEWYDAGTVCIWPL